MDKNAKTILTIGGIIVTALVIVCLIMVLVTGWQKGGWETMGPEMMGGFGFGGFVPIFMILFWGLVIWGVITLIRGINKSISSDSASLPADSALEVLKRRYARGDINKEEYEERKKDLA